MFIRPKIDVLPATQKALWPMLKEVPKDFVLYGGTAVALWFGHRISIDFDFFSTQKDLNVAKTTDELSFIKKYMVVKGCRDDKVHGSQVNYGLKIAEGPVVNLSFIRHDNFISCSFISPAIAIDNHISIASPFDLMATKINALKDRRNVKDLIDISTLIANGVSLASGFAGAMILRKKTLKDELLSYKILAEKMSYPEFLTSVFSKDNYLMDNENEILSSVIANITKEAKGIDVDKLAQMRIKNTRYLNHDEEIEL